MYTMLYVKLTVPKLPLSTFLAKLSYHDYVSVFLQKCLRLTFRRAHVWITHPHTDTKLRALAKPHTKLHPNPSSQNRLFFISSTKLFPTMKTTVLSFGVLLFAMTAVTTTCAASTKLRGVPQASRQAAAAVGYVKELLWINADSNQRISIDGSPTVPIQTNEEFADTIDGYTLPNAELSIEAIVEGGPVGSVQFTFNGVTITENFAPYAMCTNKGPDFLPCKGLRSEGGTVKVKVFAGKGATGASSATVLTYIRYVYRVEPYGSLRLYNADTDTDLGFLDDSTIVNVTETPQVAVVVDAWSRRGQWIASSASFVYDNEAPVVDGTGVLLAYPSHNGNDVAGFTPTVGSHTFVANLHSKPNLQGQSTTWGPYTFLVVL
jgi:hypothetical protein